MPAIAFTVLVPVAEVDSLHARFESLAAGMKEKKTFTDCTITCAPSAARGSEVEEQLRDIYRQQHDDCDVDDAEVFDFSVLPTGYEGSVNELAMWFARLLTPPATLPGEAALRENDALFEVPDTYPWSVQVRP